MENNVLRIENKTLKGSGISKHIEGTYTPNRLNVYNEEWGFVVINGKIDFDSLKDMSQYWFYSDYENNEEFRKKIDKSARALYNKAKNYYEHGVRVWK